VSILEPVVGACKRTGKDRAKNLSKHVLASMATEKWPGGEMVKERFTATELEKFTREIYEKVGFSGSDASHVARLMIAADLRGVDGHGIIRLPRYVRRIRAGGVNVRPNIRVVEDRLSTAIVDGDNGMGQLVMSRAAEAAIEKADRTGVAWVGARMSNHAGFGALYAEMPLARDMIGLYMAVASANHMPPWGGIEKTLGTNPLTVAIPAFEEPPVVLDMATTVVAYGKIKTHQLTGKPLPVGWMMDRHGEPITDPNRSNEGFLLPIGGYKGSGLAIVIGMLAGLLNGALFGRECIDFNADDSSVTNTGHAIVALKVSHFCPVEEFKRQVDAAIREIRNSERMDGVDRIWLPGEKEYACFLDRRANGIPMNPDLRRMLNDLAASLGTELLPDK
jgi:L-2-hydroxycarboxylate dehydrogenase (NAD+)